MKCDAGCQWGEEATIFFSYIEDGKVRKVNLCKRCAQEKGVDDPTGYSLVDMLQGMGDEKPSSTAPGGGTDELVCGDCGFSQTDFKKTGRFGCASCYSVFSDGLETLLEAMHKNTEHTGKVPTFIEDLPEDGEDIIDESDLLDDAGLDLGFHLDEQDQSTEEAPQQEAGLSPDVSIAVLQDQLDVAISAEDYEEAARLRDEISRMEAEGAS